MKDTDLKKITELVAKLSGDKIDGIIVTSTGLDSNGVQSLDTGMKGSVMDLMTLSLSTVMQVYFELARQELLPSGLNPHQVVDAFITFILTHKEGSDKNEALNNFVAAGEGRA